MHMGLRENLAELKAEFERTAPADRRALYDAKIEELRASFVYDGTVRLGAEAPGFDLPNLHGKRVVLSEQLKSGPVVLVFYRGGWCPYCNIQLRAYQTILPQISARGGHLVAISPQLPDGSVDTADKNALSFDVLSDVGNNVARSYGLVYALPNELRALLRENDRALPKINGDDSWELPVAATYVISQNRQVALAHVDVDYRTRLEPETVLAVLDDIGL